MTCRLLVTGRVQGVGFRPAVFRLARSLGVAGEVKNLGGAAEILCEADDNTLARFLSALRQLPPPARVENIVSEEIPPRVFSGFRIAESGGEPSVPVLPADLGVCPECLAEMGDPKNPRFRYPFISCAQCGPRYTIIEKLPYDRERTAMKDFPMCPRCRKDYDDPGDRRCDGQTISCPDCGPQLLGVTRGGARTEREAALSEARRLLEAGAVIAVKALGGYNLVCRADSPESVRALRKLKRRPTKPFAVLFASLLELRSVCKAGPAEAELLCSAARPIVLLRRRPGWERFVCPETADPAGTLGAFLPAVGLYAVLAEKLPLIVTSCNRSGAPILFRDEDFFAYYRGQTEIAGVFRNTREILRPADDAVARIVLGTPQILRRTRGYLPEPAVSGAPQGDLLAFGAELEPAVCAASGGRLYPAAVPGDLEEPASRELLKRTADDLCGLLGIQPKLAVRDLHPLYFTTALAEACGLPVLAVQHHHAHALAVMAEHSLSGPVLGVCFDGTGYGTDGTVWGGEFLLCEGTDFRRVGHLKAIPMLGGDLSMKQAWKSAMCHLRHAGLASRDKRFPVVSAALESGVNAIRSSSMGRLFDAAASVLGLCDENTHRGRCAQAAENAAAAALRRGAPPVPMDFAEKDGVFDPSPLFPALLAAEDREAAALGFHNAVIRMVLRGAELSGTRQIALCGGVFANRILLEGCAGRLAERGYSVYFSRQVPPGDGGVCLGQAYYGLLKG